MSELIFVEQQPTAGKEHPPRPGATVGREGCDINLADDEVSRRHAAIRRLESGLAIEDLGSTNGTFVNDRRIEGVRELREGDIVKFGNTSWKVQAATSATTIGQVPVAASAQPTAARQVPVETPPEQQAAAAPTAQPASSAAGAQGHRGDVPPPDFAPSAIRKVIPPPGAPAAFNPAAPPRSRGSAATRVEATVAAYAVTALTAGGVVAYYITKPFE